MSRPGDPYQVLGEMIGAELSCDPVALSSGMELADIPGWDSVALAGVLLAIEQQTGEEPDRDAIDHLHSVDDLVAILVSKT